MIAGASDPREQLFQVPGCHVDRVEDQRSGGVLTHGFPAFRALRDVGVG